MEFLEPRLATKHRGLPVINIEHLARCHQKQLLLSLGKIMFLFKRNQNTDWESLCAAFILFPIKCGSVEIASNLIALASNLPIDLYQSKDFQMFGVPPKRSVMSCSCRSCRVISFKTQTPSPPAPPQLQAPMHCASSAFHGAPCDQKRDDGGERGASPGEPQGAASHGGSGLGPRCAIPNHPKSMKSH